MPIVTITVSAGETPRAHALRSSAGLFVAFEVGGVTLYLPGDDAIAASNARTWAAQLLNAAEQISETLARGVTSQPVTSAPVTDGQGR